MHEPSASLPSPTAAATAAAANARSAQPAGAPAPLFAGCLVVFSPSVHHAKPLREGLRKHGAVILEEARLSDAATHFVCSVSPTRTSAEDVAQLLCKAFTSSHASRESSVARPARDRAAAASAATPVESHRRRSSTKGRARKRSRLAEGAIGASESDSPCSRAARARGDPDHPLISDQDVKEPFERNEDGSRLPAWPAGLAEAIDRLHCVTPVWVTKSQAHRKRQLEAGPVFVAVTRDELRRAVEGLCGGPADTLCNDLCESSCQRRCGVSADAQRHNAPWVSCCSVGAEVSLRAGLQCGSGTAECSVNSTLSARKLPSGGRAAAAVAGAAMHSDCDARPLPLGNCQNASAATAGTAGRAEHGAAVLSQTGASREVHDEAFVDAGFGLLGVTGQAWQAPYNHGCFGVKLSQLVCAPPGEVLELALLATMRLDIPRLMEECSSLHAAKRVIFVLNGEQEQAERDARKCMAQRSGWAAPPGMDSRSFDEQVLIFKPTGSEQVMHHSKLCLLVGAHGVRVIVLTANLRSAFKNVKTEGIWYQDFPPKDPQSPITSDFADDLWRYLQALKLPDADEERLQRAINRHNFSSARAALVASTPGTHHGQEMMHNGHMRVRALLRLESFAAKFAGSPLICQASSLGFTQEWLCKELVESFSCGGVHGGSADGESEELGRPCGGKLEGVQLVWPTAGEVRYSSEGNNAAETLHGHRAQIGLPYLKPSWRRWGRVDDRRVGESSDGRKERLDKPAHRQRAMPHIKSYCRYRGHEVAWMMLGSHNLSTAAWGQLQQGGSRLHVRNYELSVLLLPRLHAEYLSHRHAGFSWSPEADADPSRRLLRCPASLVPQPRAPMPHSGVGATSTGSPTQPAQVCFVAANQPDIPDQGNYPGNRRHKASGADHASAFSSEQEEGGGDGQRYVVALPVPYLLPPQAYGKDSKPWMDD